MLVPTHFHVSARTDSSNGAVSVRLEVIRYSLPLAVIGGLVAVFHQLLVAGVIPEDVRPCAQGVPCSQTVIEWFGFLTIPLLSVIAFSIIITLLIWAYLRSSK